MNTRPILDRVKKSLFSMLDAASLLLDARVADFYAGTGTQGIEALSRGAERCVFVEKRADAAELLNANLAKTKLIERAEVVVGSVGAEIARRRARAQAEPGQRFDLILYDPPFAFVREDAQRHTAEAELSAAGELLFPNHARLVLRLEAKVEPPAPAGLEMVRHWKDGPHAFAFYRKNTP
jgi:16S rRNA (guanine966-N2)-methyltransferase